MGDWYAEILRCSDNDYWYNKLIGQFVIIQPFQTDDLFYHEPHGTCRVWAWKSSSISKKIDVHHFSNLSKRVDGNMIFDGRFFLDMNDIKIHNPLSMRKLKLKILLI